MPKKSKPLKVNGPLAKVVRKTRNNPDSLYARRARQEEALTGVKKDRKPWLPEEDDIILDFCELNRRDELIDLLPERTPRARRCRTQHLASRVREYRGPSPERFKRRSGSPWSRFDDWVVEKACTADSVHKYGTDLDYIALVLARKRNELPQWVVDKWLKQKNTEYKGKKKNANSN